MDESNISACKAVTGEALGKLRYSRENILSFAVLSCQDCSLGVKLIEIVYQREECLFDQRKVSGNIVKNPVQSKQDGHLDQELDAAACCGHSVFFIDLLDFFLLGSHRGFIFSALILILDFFDLGLHFPLKLGKLLLTDGQRQHGHIDQDRHDDNGKSYVGKSDLPEHIENSVHDKTDQLSDRADNKRC